MEISNVRFPNLEFIDSPEFTRIVMKLYWSCYPNVTRFGYKRRRMDENFPDLCPYYEQYFYESTSLMGLMEKGISIKVFHIKLNIKIKVDAAILKSNLAELGETTALKDLLLLTDMDNTAVVRFKQNVFAYCKENLVKLVVYLPSPYVTRLVVNEVNIGYYVI